MQLVYLVLTYVYIYVYIYNSSYQFLRHLVVYLILSQNLIIIRTLEIGVFVLLMTYDGVLRA